MRPAITFLNIQLSNSRDRYVSPHQRILHPNLIVNIIARKNIHFFLDNCI